MKNIFLHLIVFIMILSSCKDHSNAPEALSETRPPRNIPQIELDSMPYTDPHELYELYAHAEDHSVIHYNIARLIAETELIAGANQILGEITNPNEEWSLTRIPKVVYNYDNTPKYYEFGYVCNGVIIATITTYAQKEIAGVIAYVFSEPLSCNHPDYDYYIGNYPNKYYGRNGHCYLDDQNEEIHGNLPPHGSTDKIERDMMFAQMPVEDIHAIEQDLQVSGESIDDDVQQKETYWEQIDSIIHYRFPDLLGVEPYLGQMGLKLDDIMHEDYTTPESEYVSYLASLLDYAVGYYNTFTLPEYSDPRLQLTRWNNFCGPAACAWVYRGKYDSFNGHYLPIKGDGNHYTGNYYIDSNYCDYAYYNFWNVNCDWHLCRNEAMQNFINRSNDTDYGLAGCFYHETVPFIWDGEWQFPLYHGGLNRGFRNATNNEYHVYFTCKPLDCILQNQQPVIIAVNCNHYLVAFGYGATLDSHGNIKDKYFMITDNGATTFPSYHPYMRRKNFWDLHYGLTH